MPSTNGLSGWVALSTRLAVLLVLVSGTSAVAAEGETPGCTPAIGRVVSRQGSVEIRRAGASTWHRVERLDTQVCDGDAVRTGPRSRAALWLQPENLIRLDQRTAVTMFSNQAETRVEFFQPTGSGPVLADPDCGAAYFISRFPRNFGVRTPFLSAAIKGTEFLVAAQCSSTTLAVFEGIVTAQELLGGREFLVESLQQISVGPGLPSAVPIPIKPRDGVQWMIYYPRTGGRRNAGQDMALEHCAVGPSGAECEIENVEALLAVGAVVEAQGAIAALRSEGASGANLSAIESIVQIALNDRDQALALAQRATESDTDSERAWSALSYAKQAKTDLDGALEAAQRAVKVAPRSSLAKAREAEMLLTVGRFKDAEVAAKAAQSLDPQESRAMQVLGFVQLARLDGAGAQKSLQASLEMDPSDPRTRLGLGLAKIRQRKLIEGREDIEIAVALDPSSALGRTYLGRAYFEENRSERDILAQEQYRLATELDPQDPTAWFYQAVLEQGTNRPLSAIDDARRSIERNNNRSVYRPGDALDQDAASRSAALARMYNSLGFEEPAVGEVATALADDATNYAAQQYLSEAAAALPRQQATRASAGLQAQLRQPLGSDAPLAGLLNVASLNPERPFLASRSLGPARGGYYDFDPVFSGPGLRARAYGLVGTSSTASQGVEASAQFDRSALAAGILHAETDGQRANNDQSRDSMAALASFQPTTATTIQVEAQQSNVRFGELPIRFDPTNYSPDQRNSEQSTVGRVGLRHQFSPQSELLAVASHTEFDFDTFSAIGQYSLTTQGSYSSPEIQYVTGSQFIQFVGGASLIEGSRRDRLDLPAFGLSFPSNSVDRSKSAYAYSTLHLAGGKLHATIGIGWDDFLLQSLNYDVERTHPKLGLVWNVDSATTIRAASFRSMQRPLVAGQTLEPVQVAGFGQFYDDIYGSISRRSAIAIDRRVGYDFFIGAGGGVRRIEATSRYFDSNGMPQFTFAPWSEREGHVYAHWKPHNQVAISIQIHREAFERTEGNPGVAQFLELVQWRAPVAIQWIGASGLSANARVSYLKQRGTFCSTTANVCDVPGQESTTMFDVGVAFRFPRRAGGVSVDVLNLTDQTFLYQSLDTSRFVPILGRAVFGRVYLNF